MNAAIHPRPFSIGRPTHKIGYFEVWYRHDGADKSCCLVAHGFQEAVLRFQELHVGVHTFLREITQAHFEAWFAVSLHAAQTVEELRSGVHL